MSSAVAVRMRKSLREAARRSTLLAQTDGRRVVQIPSRQRDILEVLAIYDDWARPMDVGAIDGSHHTMSLRALVKKGLAERQLRGSLLNQIRGSDLYERIAADRLRGRKHGRSVPRGSYVYRISTAGREILK